MSFDLKFQNNAVKLLADKDLDGQTINTLTVTREDITATAIEYYGE